METVLSVQIEELTRLQEEEHSKLGSLLQDNEVLLSKVNQCKWCLLLQHGIEYFFIIFQNNDEVKRN